MNHFDLERWFQLQGLNPDHTDYGYSNRNNDNNLNGWKPMKILVE